MRRFLTLTIALIGFVFAACESTDEGKKGEVVVTSSTNVSIGVYEGESTITYKIVGVEDGLADIEISSEWLRVKESVAGEATIQFEENTTGGVRMAAVTLAYGSSKASVVFTQSNTPEEPILTPKCEELITIDRCGQKVVLNYTLENRNPVDYIYAKTSANWIYSINCDMDGEVVLGVATNDSGEVRETKITVGYGSASFDVVLTQVGDGEINFNAPILTGEYLGDTYTPGAGNYWFFLTDRGFDVEGNSLANTTYYRIDAYGPVASSLNVSIPQGTYTFDSEDTCELWTFTAEYSGHWVTDVNARRGDIKPFESGTLVVDDKSITLDVVIDGENHHVVFVGRNELVDNQDSVVILTTLEDDYVADLSNHYMVYECYGDYYDFGYYNWMFVIQPKSGAGDCLQFDIITGFSDEQSGFAGEYIASEYLAKNSFIYGWTDNHNLLCSWFFNTIVTESYVEVGDMAPLRGGNMEVIDNGDGTFTVNAITYDDLGNNITATWTGEAQRAETAQSSVFRK